MFRNSNWVTVVISLLTILVKMRLSLSNFVAAGVLIATVDGFTPTSLGLHKRVSSLSSTATELEILPKTGKPTGTAFLPAETVERCEKGSAIEKAKMKKDPTNAWVDIYDYAAKIRAGELNWEDIEKAEMNTVRQDSPRQ